MKLKMFQRVFRQTILSNQFNVNFQPFFDVKRFSLSSIYSHNSTIYNLRPSRPFFLYYKLMLPILKEENPSHRHSVILHAVAEKWRQLSEKEKGKYKAMCKDNRKEFKVHSSLHEIKIMTDEVKELVHDRTPQYTNSWHLAMTDVMRNDKKNRLTRLYESERSEIQKRFDETRQELEKWKQRVEKDGRAKTIIRNLDKSLNIKLQSLQFDKPKYCSPPAFYFKQNFNSFKETTSTAKMQESQKKWKTMSEEEKEPYYKAADKYYEDMIVWKEKIYKDGRINCIEAIKKSLNQLKL